MPSLRELQRRFYGTIVRPHDLVERAGHDPELLQIVERRGPLGPAERVEIYAHMYCARIIDVLSEDFPSVVSVLGAERFHETAHAYVDATPSMHPSLRHAGGAFADFLAARVHDAPPWLADLARLERARLDAFDAGDETPLCLDELRGLPGAEWGDIPMRLVPSVRVLHVRWPVHVIWDAATELRTTHAWRAEEAHLRVWRSGFLVYQARMDEIERRALASLAGEATFGDVCGALEVARPAGDAVREAGALLLRWIEDGILAALPGAPPRRG